MITTKDGKMIEIEALKQNEVIALLKPINPKLAELIKKVNSKQTEYTFYKASYSFADKIIDGHKCYLPLSDGNSIELNDPKLPDAVLNDLSYNTAIEDPLAMILNKNSELYVSANGGIVPYSVLNPGHIFGTPRAVCSEEKNIPTSSLVWNLNAGARSLFLLSKVSSKNKHIKLQRIYGTDLTIPFSPTEHFSLFKNIAKRSQSKWRSEILFFSRKWINQLKDPAWAELANYINQLHRNSYTIWHNMSFIWSAAFNDIEQQRRLDHYSEYTLSNARQLFIIASNSSPGFRPATNDEQAPISLFQEIYGTNYGLYEDNQSTVIMEPSSFSNSDPIYYSLNHPTLVQNNPGTFKGKSLLTLLGEIRTITEAYQKAILSDTYKIQSLYEIANTTNFSYYHSNSYRQQSIHEDIMIPDDDARFIQHGSGNFPGSSWFFRGCIKISSKK